MSSPPSPKTVYLPRLWIILGMLVFFSLVLMGLWYIYRVYFHKPALPVIPTIPAITPRKPVTVPPVKFTDVTRDSGIAFRSVNGAAGDRLLPETMTGGVAILDYDNDARQDILFVNARPWPGKEQGPLPTMALYRNLGGFKFQDVTKEMGLDIPLFGMGVCSGDIDNDGWADLFIAGVGGNRLFRNDQGKRFIDITRQAGVGGPDTFPICSYETFKKRTEPLTFPSSTTFLDYDGDGKLDLLVCHYVTWSPADDLAIHAKLGGITRTYDQPIWFQGAQPVLYRNKNGTHFEDVSAQTGMRAFAFEGVGQQRKKQNAGKILGVITADVNQDGWLDVMMACDTTRNLLFLNTADGQGSRKFEEAGEAYNIAYADSQARGGMGIDWAEYHRDKYAFVITNFAKEPLSFFTRSRPNSGRFTDRCMAEGLFGLSRNPVKFGTFFFDYDLDGRLDLFFCNGHLEPDINRLEDWQTYAQAAQLYWNTGESPGAFEPVQSDSAGKDLYQPIVGRGSAYADLDGDGDLDLVLMNNQGEPLILRNDQKLGHSWLRLVLEGDGQTVNRSAVGVQLMVEFQGKKHHRQVVSGRGYLSQSELPVTLGLGTAQSVEKVTIYWPGMTSGPQVVTNLAANQTVKVTMTGTRALSP